MRVHDSLSGTAADVHAHVESVAATVAHQGITVPVGLAETFHDVVLGVVPGHEQPVSGRDWIAVAENLDRVKV